MRVHWRALELASQPGNGNIESIHGFVSAESCCLSLASKSGGMQESLKAMLTARLRGSRSVVHQNLGNHSHSARSLREAGPADGYGLVHCASILSPPHGAANARLLELSNAFAEHLEAATSPASLSARTSGEASVTGGVCMAASRWASSEVVQLVRRKTGRVPRG